jgi:hypothetical protein
MGILYRITIPLRIYSRLFCLCTCGTIHGTVAIPAISQGALEANAVGDLGLIVESGNDLMVKRFVNVHATWKFFEESWRFGHEIPMENGAA